MMSSYWRTGILTSLGTWLAIASVSGSEPRPVDADLPAPFDNSLAEPLLEHSPFTRALNL
jgi:hypothetical protein